MTPRQATASICALVACACVAWFGQADGTNPVWVTVNANNDSTTGDPFNIGAEAYYGRVDPNQAVQAGSGWTGRPTLFFKPNHDLTGADRITASLTNGSFASCPDGTHGYILMSQSPMLGDESMIAGGLGSQAVYCNTEAGQLQCQSAELFGLNIDFFYTPACVINLSRPSLSEPWPMLVDPGLPPDSKLAVTISVRSDGVQYASALTDIAQIKQQYVGCVQRRTDEVLDPNAVTFHGGQNQTSAGINVYNRQQTDTSSASGTSCLDGPPDSSSMVGTFALQVWEPQLKVLVKGRQQPAVDQVQVDGVTVPYSSQLGGWPTTVTGPGSQPSTSTYYWRLDEVDEVQPVTFGGSVWSFSSDQGKAGELEQLPVMAPAPLGRWVGADAPDPCLVDDESHCLNLARFSTHAEWTDHDGNSGNAQVVPWASWDSGLYWFFSEANVEMVIKVLDGCWLNDRYWVFAAGLTDVGVDLTITDTLTGDEKVYTNPLGTPFQTVTDTEAFSFCLETAKAAPAAKLEEQATSLSRELDAVLSGLGAGSVATAKAGSCVDDDETLCLQDSRYAVTAAWTSSQASGAGQAKRLTADTGFFWFFDSSNIEVIIKVLDACGINQRHWVFAGGLTDVQVHLRVEDTVSGAVKEYDNPLGSVFAPITDTDAFASCE